MGEDVTAICENLESCNISPEPQSPQKSKGSSRTTSKTASPEKQLVKKVSYEVDSIGKVKITVVKAADLKKKSDPYTVVSSGKESFKSKTLKKTQEPEWNHEVEFSMMSKQPGEVKIEVFNKKTLGKDELLGFVLLPTKDLLQPPHLINSWFKLEGAKSGQVFVAGGYIPAELPRKEAAAEKVAKVALDSELATALTKQQQKIDEDTTVDRSQQVPKMSVQTIKIDDDLQSALKKQQRKIDVEEEKERQNLEQEASNDVREGSIGRKAAETIPAEKEELEGRKKVEVEVVAARNLQKSGMFGKADPYVTITYGKEKHISNVINNDLNPEWNFKDSLLIDSNSSEK